jgi:hypothetical protein
MKINGGSGWLEAKALKIWTGLNFETAKKAYVYDNGWKIAYPNLPQSPNLTLLYSGTTYPSVPTTWSIMGNWNMDPAYAPVSFTYQWKRGGSNISGATSATYTTTAQDVDSTIGVTVVATNGRGSTTISQSNGSVILPTISTMFAYDSTATPSQPSVSISPNNLSYSGSWTSSSNATTYSVSTDKGSVSTSGQTFSGSGSVGRVTVSVTPINTNKTVYIFWSAATGASSYDIVKLGNGVSTTVNVPSSTTNYTWSIADGNETNQFTVYPKSPAGAKGYGMSQSVTVSNKLGSAGSAFTDLGCTAGYINDWTYGGVTWSGNCVSNSEAGTFSYRYATYRNSDCTTEDIYQYGSYATSRYCVPTCTAGWIDDDYTYNVTWSGVCESNSLEGGTSAGRTRNYRYADCSTALITEQGPFYRTRACTYTPPPECVCNYTTTPTQSYHYAPECCPGGSRRAGSLSGNTVNACCPNVSKTATGKYACKSFDVTNAASSNYSTCFSVGACDARFNSDGSRDACYA